MRIELLQVLWSVFLVTTEGCVFPNPLCVEGDCTEGVCVCYENYAGTVCNESDFTLSSVPDVNEDVGSVTITITKLESTELQLTIEAVGPTAADVTIDPASIDTDSGTDSVTFDVSVVDDDIMEPEETVELEVRSQGLNIKRLSFNILQSDPINISVVGPLVLNEGDGNVGIVIQCEPPDGTSPSEAQFSVQEPADLDASDGEATTTVFDCDASNQFFVNLINDKIPEVTKIFNLEISGATSNDVIMGDTSTVITIEDNDPVFIISRLSRTISENEEKLDFSQEVFQNEDGTDVAVDLTLEIQGGSAVENSDYSASSTRVDLNIDPASAASREDLEDLEVMSLDDQIFEPNKQFSVVYTSSGYELAGSTVVQITVADDDLESFTFEGPDEVAEQDGNVMYTVRRTSVFAITTLNYTVAYDNPDPSLYNTNVKEVTSSLEFIVGDAEKSFTVEIVNDEVYEIPESFSITITSNDRVASIPVKNVLITEDDLDVLTISGPQTIVEGSGTETTDYAVTRQSMFEEVTLTYEIQIPASGVHLVSEDDINLETGNITMETGETSAVISVTILGDTILEPDEMFLIYVSGPDTVSPAEMNVTVTNDDRDDITATSFLVAAEDQTSVEVELTRTLDTNQIFVYVTTSDIDATAGSDYKSLSDHSVTFEAGSLTTTFNVELLSDNINEGDEEFEISISGEKVNPTAFDFLIVDTSISLSFDCRRNGQKCYGDNSTCYHFAPYCQCIGFPLREGKRCSIVTELLGKPVCDTVTCSSHGQCVEEGGQPVCKCDVGYYGDDCEHFYAQVFCSKTGMRIVINPHDDFIGNISVKGWESEAACMGSPLTTADKTAAGLDETLEGYSVEVDYDSGECGVISPVAQGTKTSYTVAVSVVYDPTLRTSLDQCIMASCTFNNKNLPVESSLAITQDGDTLPSEAVNNTFSPVTVQAEAEGLVVSDGTSVVLNNEICINFTLIESLGAVIIQDITFINTLSVREPWPIFDDGCPVDESYLSVVKRLPFYPDEGNKRNIRFCFRAFVFATSDQILVTTTLDICVDEENCVPPVCSSRKKRQTGVEMKELTVTRTFNVIVPEVKKAENISVSTPDDYEPVQPMMTSPDRFLPIVLGLGAILFVLIFVCIFLACGLFRRRRRDKKNTFKDFYATSFSTH